MLNASNFKVRSERLTQKRVEMVMRYVIYCYQKMINENKTYKKTDFLNESKTRYNLEEGLSEKFVDEYLGIWNNLEYYKKYISDKPDIHLYFNNESKQSYTENDAIKDDFIDIKVQETGLSDIWSSNGNQQQIHLAIECKVVENGYSEYVSDIKKMCDRSFNTPRLKFEGQLAYITNPSYTHSSIVFGVNKNLSTNGQIDTTQELKINILDQNFDASYLSVHKRNHNNQQFLIYHLMFDYSKVVIN
jgi:hypothetical protein